MIRSFQKLLLSTEEIQKGSSYKFLEDWLGLGLLTSTGTKWFSHRKMLTPCFHFSILETFMDTFNKKCEIFLNKLKKIPPGSEYNIYEPISLLSLDTICDAVMGIDMKTQEETNNPLLSKYTSAIYLLTDVVVKRIFAPWLHPNFVFYSLTSTGKRFAKSIQNLHMFTNKVVQDKRLTLQNGNTKTAVQEDSSIGIKKKQCFLDLLLERSDRLNILTDEEVREEVDTFIFQGHDTTTSGLAWTLFCLGNHPNIQEKVYNELNTIFMDEQRNVTLNDLKEIKYLELVIKESLRLYPSVPFFHRCLRNDMKFGEYLIPAGVDVFVSAYHVHRSPEYYENPEEFNPDNFLPECIKNRPAFSYIPFSAGPRNCIGQKFAMMEMKTILAKTLLSFRIESVKKFKEFIPVADVILRPKSNELNVKLYPRQQPYPLNNLH
uniref:Cytochrome P450 n=1 Tax=Clastoptera arizonana TaxID=38151 RepID=A0A1B6CLP6_9HEMI